MIAKGRNQDQLLHLAKLARQTGVELRLIEFMDVGNRNGWSSSQVLTASEMIQTIGSVWPLQPVGRSRHSTAQRWRYLDGAGYLAVVASISSPFCGDCTRLRVTADGVAYSCLFASSGLDLKPWLRPRLDSLGLEQALTQLWRGREDRYSEERKQFGAAPRAEMAYLGG